MSDSATVDCSPPGSSVHGISQARILELVAISFSRGPSPPRDGSHVSCITGAFLITEPPGKPVFNFMYYLSFLWLHKLPFLLLVFLNFTHFKIWGSVIWNTDSFFFFSFLYRKKMDKTWVFVDRTGLGCWWITGWALKKKKKVIAPPPLRPAPPPGAPRCCPGLRRILRRAVLRQSGMSRPRWEPSALLLVRGRVPGAWTREPRRRRPRMDSPGDPEGPRPPGGDGEPEASCTSVAWVPCL